MIQTPAKPKSILQGKVNPRVISSVTLKDDQKIVINKKPTVDRSSKPSFEITPRVKKLTEYIEFLHKLLQLTDKNCDREESLLVGARDINVLKSDKELQDSLAEEKAMVYTNDNNSKIFKILNYLECSFHYTWIIVFILLYMSLLIFFQYAEYEKCRLEMKTLTANLPEQSDIEQKKVNQLVLTIGDLTTQIRSLELKRDNLYKYNQHTFNSD